MKVKTKPMKFQPGTIIKRRLSGFWGFCYCHMGIVSSEGDVIHFSGEHKKDNGATIRRDSIDTFAASYPIKIHAEPKSSAHAKSVVAQAEEAISAHASGENAEYDFVRNNCEDFCINCFEAPYHV